MAVVPDWRTSTGHLSQETCESILAALKDMNRRIYKGEIKPYINLTGGIVSVDDTIADKPYSNPDKTELIGTLRSGKHHQVFKGINIVSLYYRDPSGKSVPVNYRIYDNQEGKTKNDYFREMFEEVISWGLKPWLVTGDSWYSSARKSKVSQELRK